MEAEVEGSGIYCTSCGDELEFTDEVFMFHIVHVLPTQRKLHVVDVLEADGGFRYIPVFWCFDCWEEAQEEVKDQQEDTPPIEADGSVAECDICGSDILVGEAFATAAFGELHLSDRAPSREYAAHFVSMKSDTHICIGCLHHMEENRDTPIWKTGVEPIPGHPACLDGLFERCWRTGSCEHATCTQRTGEYK